MENKYFTPDIEDLCIGYECEINNTYGKWESITITFSNSNSFYKTDLAEVCLLVEDKYVRVPYLTKEQIEAEGWELIQIYPTGACIFQKGTKEKGCELTYNFEEHRAHFTKLYFYGLDDEYTRTKLTWNSLECKDINTFRKIIKLLNIN
jgi:hypothetical protein